MFIIEKLYIGSGIKWERIYTLTSLFQNNCLIKICITIIILNLIRRDIYLKKYYCVSHYYKKMNNNSAFLRKEKG
jgi:hypothetical protein